MTLKNEPTVNNNEAAENNYQPRELKLEPKELMRFSLFDVGEEDNVEVNYVAADNLAPINVLNALTSLLDKLFGMTCVPKKGFGGVIVCGGSKEEFEEFLASMTDDDDGNNGEGEHTDAKGETIH